MGKALIPMQIVVLAAGHGKRMNNSELPKALVPLNGRPIIKYLLEAIKKSGVTSKPVIVVGQKAEVVKQALGSEYDYVFQAEQLGTGHAVACTKDFIDGKAANIMVLYGDHPLISSNTIKNLINAHLQNKSILTMATVKVRDFKDWRKPLYDFGRIIRDNSGKIVKIVEKKDAVETDLEIKEVNPSFFCFDTSWLWVNIGKLSNNNKQREFYLTDLVQFAFEQGHVINDIEINSECALGVNTLEQLNLVKKLLP